MMHDLIKGNTGLSRETQPIVEIQLVGIKANDGPGDIYWIAKGGTRIEAYDEIGGDGCYVPWVVVITREGKPLMRCRADRCVIKYTLCDTH